MGRHCMVPFCTNRSRKKEEGEGTKVRYFSLSANRKEAWLRALGRYDDDASIHNAVCSDHFTPNDFKPNGKLKETAVPSQKLRPEKPRFKNQIVLPPAPKTDKKLFVLPLLKKFVDDDGVTKSVVQFIPIKTEPPPDRISVSSESSQESPKYLKEKRQGHKKDHSYSSEGSKPNRNVQNRCNARKRKAKILKEKIGILLERIENLKTEISVQKQSAYSFTSESFVDAI